MGTCESKATTRSRTRQEVIRFIAKSPDNGIVPTDSDSCKALISIRSAVVNSNHAANVGRFVSERADDFRPDQAGEIHALLVNHCFAIGTSKSGVARLACAVKDVAAAPRNAALYSTPEVAFWLVSNLARHREHNFSKWSLERFAGAINNIIINTQQGRMLFSTTACSDAVIDALSCTSDSSDTSKGFARVIASLSKDQPINAKRFSSPTAITAIIGALDRATTATCVEEITSALGLIVESDPSAKARLATTENLDIMLRALQLQATTVNSSTVLISALLKENPPAQAHLASKKSITSITSSYLVTQPPTSSDCLPRQCSKRSRALATVLGSIRVDDAAAKSLLATPSIAASLVTALVYAQNSAESEIFSRAILNITSLEVGSTVLFSWENAVDMNVAFNLHPAASLFEVLIKLADNFDGFRETLQRNTRPELLIQQLDRDSQEVVEAVMKLVEGITQHDPKMFRMHIHSISRVLKTKETTNSCVASCGRVIARIISSWFVERSNDLLNDTRTIQLHQHKDEMVHALDCALNREPNADVAEALCLAAKSMIELLKKWSTTMLDVQCFRSPTFVRGLLKCERITSATGKVIALLDTCDGSIRCVVSEVRLQLELEEKEEEESRSRRAREQKAMQIRLQQQQARKETECHRKITITSSPKRFSPRDLLSDDGFDEVSINESSRSASCLAEDLQQKLMELASATEEELDIKINVLDGSLLQLNKADCIGDGHFSRVVSAQVRGEPRKYAAKVIRHIGLNLTANSPSWCEASLLFRLCHRHIIKLHHVTVDPTSAQIVLLMDQASSNLHTFLSKRTTPLVFSQIRSFATQIASALSYLHSDEIRTVHCDLKPTNIVVFHKSEADEPTLKLIDFGGAVEKDGGRSTARSNVGGTCAYLPPECHQNRRKGAEVAVNFSIDVYSFGVTLLEFVAGKHYHNPAGNSRSLKNEINRNINDFVDQCAEMHKEGACAIDISKLILDNEEMRHEMQPLLELIKDCLMMNKKERLKDGGEILKRLMETEQKTKE